MRAHEFVYNSNSDLVFESIKNLCTKTVFYEIAHKTGTLVEDITPIQDNIPLRQLSNDDVNSYFFPVIMTMATGNVRQIDIYTFGDSVELHGIDKENNYYFNHDNALYTVNNTSARNGIQRIIFNDNKEYNQFLMLLEMKFTDFSIHENSYTDIKAARVELNEAPTKWYGDKHPGDMSEKEFIDQHYTGYIPSETYADMTKPEDESWQGRDKHEYPKLIGKKEVNGKIIEFRQSIEENRYVKKDSTGNIVRDENGRATYQSRNEMHKKGLAIYDQTIFVFRDNEYIGVASNEWGAIGVWVRDDHQNHGIGSYLLKLFIEQNPEMQIGQMTEMGYGMARKVWEMFYAERQGKAPPKLKKNSLREEYEHMDSDLRDVASWMDTTVDNLHIEVDLVPIEHFEKQIKEMYNTYEEYPNDAERTKRIIDQIKSGAKPLPIYIDISNPTGLVMEGRHRMVAFWLLGMKEIPVAYVYNKIKHSQYIADDINSSDQQYMDRMGINLIDQLEIGVYGLYLMKTPELGNIPSMYQIALNKRDLSIMDYSNHYKKITVKGEKFPLSSIKEMKNKIVQWQQEYDPIIFASANPAKTKTYAKILNRMGLGLEKTEFMGQEVYKL
jgi:hypothetical protein